MILIIKRIITVLMMLFFISCDKPIIDIFTDCDSINYSSINTWEYANNYYLAPCFNPENSNEFIYVLDKPNDPTFSKQLWKYNLTTKEKSYITDNVWYYPKYGLDDWIFLNRFNQQIWKVKSNGDSLQPLFTEELNYDVEPCIHDKRIVFRRIIESDYFVMFSDYNGNILYQTIDKVFSDGAWSGNGEKFFPYIAIIQEVWIWGLLYTTLCLI